MKHTQKSRADLVTDSENQVEEQQGSKMQFNEPKLKFIEPKLTAKGDLREITGGFAFFGGGFSP